MLRLLWSVVVFLLLGVVVLFAYSNAVMVELNYLWGAMTLPLSLVVAMAFAIGCIFCYFLYLPFFFRQRREIKRLKRLSIAAKVSPS